ncbi:MAG: DNA repair protein RecN [Bacteroidota bacterium]
MLQSLRIQNFALIEEIDIQFKEGLTVITGETGAGKSILLGALGLALGNRFEINAINNKNKKCVIETRFDLRKYDLQLFFSEKELDYEEITTIRREITTEAKSRSFINDTPVTATIIKELGEQLIDIHSQHETILLKENYFQLKLVDSFSKTTALFVDFKKQYSSLQKTKKQLADFLEKESQAKKEFDYVQFQFNELDSANLKIGELKALEDESRTLSNAEFIKGNLIKTNLLLSGGEENIISALNQSKQALQSISKFGNQFNDLFERINSLSIELKELNADIVSTEEDVVFDHLKLEIVNTHLDKIYKLLKKHHLNTEEELLNLKNSFEEKLQQFSSIESIILKLQQDILEQEKQCLDLAKILSKKRRESVIEIEESIKTLLSNLSMPNAQFKILITDLESITSNGIDKIDFLFSANKGQDFKEIGKTASGGELSRLMLCLKSLLAQRTLLPTIIFDEIDTGVSGDVAGKIGNILEDIGKSMQVITITHLPQIASKGKNHMFVYKTENQEKTISNIKQLNKTERIEEIAKMLSAGKPTEIALKNAKELLNA